MKRIEGNLVASGRKVAIVAARFNAFIVESLISGASDALIRHGVKEEDLTLVRVPGAFELPPVVHRVAGSGKVDAVLALGCVIRGGTPHFEYVCSEAAKGIGQVGMQVDIPVVFGVLTCDSIEQAIERAGTKAGNKGVEAATAAIEMMSLYQQLGELA